MCRARQCAEPGKRAMQAILQFLGDILWLIQVARALSQWSPSGSQEQGEGTRWLLARLQGGDLSLEQEVQVARALYQWSPYGSQEQRKGFQLLCQMIQNTAIEHKTRLELALLPFKSPRNNFEERVLGLRMLLQLTEEDNARDLLQAHWRSPSIIMNIESPYAREQYSTYIPAIPAIFELLTQDLIPLEARDQLYQLLQELLPFFAQMDQTIPPGGAQLEVAASKEESGTA
ncbi:MAG TPA: hypothetical protein VGD98_00450 [Ktedonobacteraceae bacterium]